jgi:hypothetical protein
MGYYRDNLQLLIGRVRQEKDGASAEQCRTWINDTLQDIYKTRPLGWSDTILTVTVQIPTPVSAGTIALTQNSNVVTGTGTSWPVSDVVNSTLLTPITRTGNVDFQISAAQALSVTSNSILYVDTGVSAEAVPIVYKNGTTFTGYFNFVHPSGVPVTQSSLAGMQFTLGTNFPIFNVLAVVSATSLILDVTWTGAAQSALGYQILTMYTPVCDRCNHVRYALDQFQGIPLSCNLSRQFLDQTDPQRSSPGDPIAIVSYGNNPNGNWLWELWPAATSPRTLSVVVNQGFAELVNNDDRPPNFLDPAMIAKRAIAIAKRTRLSREDRQVDLQLSQILMKEYEDDKQKAVEADEARCVQEYSNAFDRLVPGFNQNFWLNHDPDAMAGNF